MVTDLPHQTEHLAATLLAAAVVMVLAAVLVTNRFLTRFVFRHIQEPLETLAEGVHQIRDGNLTHRIAYDSRDEFQPVCEDFNDMAQRLRASVEQSQREEASRKELLASISHDIRSPLTAIQAYVEGLLDGVADTPEKQREYLTILQAKATEMDQLVRKIFLFSKMDLGEYPYSPEPLDPAQEVAAVVAAILVVAGVGMWVWHEQPSFCNAVCHTPMDSYVEAYYADDATLLATSHRVADVSCLDCHVPTLGEQLAEGAAWVAGGYELPLEQRQFDDEFCMNGSCHAIGQGSLAQITAQREYNPHSNYHEELACGTCHKSHTASVMQCAQCHSDADVPAGWVVR